MACAGGGSCCQHRAEASGSLRLQKWSSLVWEPLCRVCTVHGGLGKRAQFTFLNRKERRFLSSNQNQPWDHVSLLPVSFHMRESHKFITMPTSNRFNCRVPHVKTGSQCVAGTRKANTTDLNQVTLFVSLMPTGVLALLASTYTVSQKKGEMKKYLCWLPNQVEDKLLLSSSFV